jgi:hypothetical protein
MNINRNLQRLARAVLAQATRDGAVEFLTGGGPQLAFWWELAGVNQAMISRVARDPKFAERKRHIIEQGDYLTWRRNDDEPDD